MKISLFISKKKENKQMSILFVKIQLENHNGFKTLKEFMDNKQYTRNGVLRYEKIFGEGFVSTGGIDTTGIYEFYDYFQSILLICRKFGQI